MTIIAQSETVKVGYLELEGFMLPGGVFGMSQTQLILLAGVTNDTNYASSRYTEISRSKQAKTLVPQGFVVHGKTSVVGRKEKVNIVELESIAPFLTVCLSMGYKEAAKPLTLLSGAMLHKLFCDTFKIKCETDELQEYFRARTSVIEKRNSWTRSIDDYIKANESNLSESYKNFVWSNVSDALNLGLTGRKAKYWRELLGCKNSELRDHWTPKHLNKIEHLEKYAEKLVTKKGMEPHEAMKAALDFYEFEILDKSEFIRS